MYSILCPDTNILENTIRPIGPMYTYILIVFLILVGGYGSYLVPAAALGAMGYCYMWWKGLSFSDVMFVTKQNMAIAVVSVSKQLDSLTDALTTTKKHLSKRLENLDWKLEEQKEISGQILNDVTGVMSNISQIVFDIEFIREMVNGLEGKIEHLKSKQDLTNSGVYYLCQVAGGFKNGLNARLFQDFGSKLDPPKVTCEDNSRKGLQLLTDATISSVVAKPITGSKIDDLDEVGVKNASSVKVKTIIHRSEINNNWNNLSGLMRRRGRSIIVLSRISPSTVQQDYGKKLQGLRLLSSIFSALQGEG